HGCTPLLHYPGPHNVLHFHFILGDRVEPVTDDEWREIAQLEREAELAEVAPVGIEEIDDLPLFLGGGDGLDPEVAVRVGEEGVDSGLRGWDACAVDLAALGGGPVECGEGIFAVCGGYGNVAEVAFDDARGVPVDIDARDAVVTGDRGPECAVRL